MKKLLLLFATGLIFGSSIAQSADSVLIREIQEIKKDLGRIEMSMKKLKSDASRLSKEIQVNREEIRKTSEKGTTAVGDLDNRLSKLQNSVESHQKASEEKFNAQAVWSRKMITILLVLIIILFGVLLLIILISGSKIRKTSLSMDAKVDNIKEKLEHEIQEIMSRHQEDHEALKKQFREGKSS